MQSDGETLWVGRYYTPDAYHADPDCANAPDEVRPLEEADLRRSITACRTCFDRRKLIHAVDR